ncbi:MAG: hypothetical protein PHD67_06405 [Oscillospiraceae bacterium]|nr:hypothetical protein [Oscillospiraceae bacterium]
MFTILSFLLLGLALGAALLGVLLFVVKNPRANAALFILNALWALLIVAMGASALPANWGWSVFLSWCLILPALAGVLLYFSGRRGLPARILVLLSSVLALLAMLAW